MIRCQKLFPDARIPVRAHDGDAAHDVFSYSDVTIEPKEREPVRSGITMSIPPGFCVMVLPRSGLARKYGVTLSNAPGLIDSGYRGELEVVLINHGPRPYEVVKGDRVAQLLILKFCEGSLIEADPLRAPDDRSTGGFGSTGR